MSDETLLTPEERLQELSDILLSNIVCSDDQSKEKRQYLFGQLPVRAFRDENYILYKIMFSFKDKGITPDTAFLKMYLMRHTKIFTDSSQFIDLSAYSDVDENPYVGYISAVINQHTRLEGMEKQGVDDFKLTIEKYKVYMSSLTGKAITAAPSAVQKPLPTVAVPTVSIPKVAVPAVPGQCGAWNRTPR